MATSLSFTTSSSVPVSPATSSLWEEGDAPTGFVRRVMAEADSGTTSSQEWTGTTSLGDEICQIQYVSAKPLQAQTINGTIDVTTQQRVSATGATHFSLVIRVVTSTGSSRGTLLDLSNNTNSIPSSSYSDVSELGASLSSVSPQEGDYLVVEFGYRIQNTSSKTFGTKAGAGTIDFTDTILFINPPTNLTYTYTSLELFVDDAITTNSATYTNNGGTHTFSVATGSLPAGVSLNTTTGDITGTPTADGVYTVTIRVTNQVGSTDSPSITWTVLPPPNCTLDMGKIGTSQMEL